MARRSKILTLFLYLIFLLFAALTFIAFNKFSEADTIVRTIEAAIIIVLSGAFMYKLQMDDNVKEPTKLYSYWINLSFLIYFSGVFMLFMNMDFLRKSTQTTAYIFWGLHQFLNFTTNILISIGVWKLKPKY
ncbi:MAG: hypothetical protein IT236_09420 [Bacteroidia bacterium]|nr:hypothetical protein [Bacteroidia bacterium]